MQIKRNSFVYKTAYYFTDEKKRPLGNINGCSLFWRFIFYGAFFGLFWLVVSLILFPVIFVGSSIILLARWPLGILVGRKLVFYRRALAGDDWETVAINRVWPANWKWVPIESWPRFFGWRILPIGVVAVLSACCAVGLIVSMNWVLGGMAAQGDSSALIMLIGEIVIGIGILAGFSASAIRQSSVGQLVSANLRSFKNRTCPVIRVID